jgi:hypothetical protein
MTGKQLMIPWDEITTKILLTKWSGKSVTLTKELNDVLMNTSQT